MKIYKDIIPGFAVIVLFLCACEPRIDFDEGQWGDFAAITEVLLFRTDEQQHNLQDYYENDQKTTGIQRVFLTAPTTVDEGSATVIVNAASVDLTNIGIVIRHKAVRIEPLGNAPRAGYLADFSNGPYAYRVVSVNGVSRDWTIVFNK